MSRDENKPMATPGVTVEQYAACTTALFILVELNEDLVRGKEMLPEVRDYIELLKDTRDKLSLNYGAEQKAAFIQQSRGFVAMLKAAFSGRPIPTGGFSGHVH